MRQDLPIPASTVRACTADRLPVEQTPQKVSKYRSLPPWTSTLVVVSRNPVSGQVSPPSRNHFRIAALSYVIPVSACAAQKGIV